MLQIHFEAAGLHVPQLDGIAVQNPMRMGYLGVKTMVAYLRKQPVEKKIDIPEGRKDDFRREIMNYIGALAIDGKKFDYKTNERLMKALELKLFEDQKDSIKLTSLVSNVVDKATQEKIDVVKSRLIK